MSRQAAIIIPFYQQERGILRKAIASAIAQPLPDDVTLWIIIVDDQSPISPDDEIADLKLPQWVKLTIQRAERNGGPGAARNIGLDLACTGGVHYCAFLDSDDIWIGPHLGNAIAMIDEGSDVYFSDHRRAGDYESAFESGSPLFWNAPEVRAARTAQGTVADGLARFTLDAGFVRHSLIHEYVFQTSTVVFSIKAVGKIRFDTRLRSAGEDHLFWFDLASTAKRFAVSSAVEVECGFGVNIYFGSFSWKNPSAVNRYGYRYIMFREFQSRGVENKLDARRLRREAGKMRMTYVYLLFRHLFRGNVPDWTLLRLVLSRTLGA